MTDYKLVPVEPTLEMVQAACDEEQLPLPMWIRMKAIYTAMLAAAPAVQGEPVALPSFASKIMEKLSRFNECAEDGQDADIGRHWLDILTRLGLLNRVQRSPARWEISQQGEDALAGHAAPQPAEHQPDDAAVDRFATAMKAKLAKKRTEGRSGWQDATAAYLSHLLHEHVRKGDPVDVGNLAMMLHQNGQGIEQKPVPDVAQLVEALEEIDAWVSRWCADDHPVAKSARNALAAYRKGGWE